MNFAIWECFIKQIAAESLQEPREAGKQKILTDWRAGLQKEPTFLKPFQIDEIMRQVRKRLDSGTDHPRQPDLAQEGKTPNSG